MSTDIWEQQLGERLGEYGSLPVVIGPNVADQPDLFPRIRVYFVFNDGSTITLHGGRYTQGMMRIVVLDKPGEGSAKSRLLADALAAHFAPYQDLGAVRIIRKPTVFGGMPGETAYEVSMSVHFIALET